MNSAAATMPPAPPAAANVAGGKGAGKLALLDGMRGVGACVVAICHTDSMRHLAIFKHNQLAVDMFFIMSGLVIGRAYDAKMTNGELTRRGFIRVRFIRLYPLFLLATLNRLRLAVREAPGRCRGPLQRGRAAALLRPHPALPSIGPRPQRDPHPPGRHGVVVDA
jgi:hypothetical protein